MYFTFSILGEIIANGIKDFKRIFYVKSKENDVENKLISVDSIWYDSDNISPKK